MNGRRSATGRRVSRHLWLFAANAAMVTWLFVIGQSDDWRHLLSLATAYPAMLGLGITLALGPINLIRGAPNPVSTNLRRDIGIWSGIVGLAHVLVGIQEHMRPRFWLYFVYPPDEHHRLPVRHDAFGITNWMGLAATIVLLLLLALSNDVSLRRLGTARWKALQRWNYAGLALIVLHGFIFQFIEGRQLPWVVAFGAMTMVILALQWAGVRAHRRARPPDGAGPVTGEAPSS